MNLDPIVSLPPIHFIEIQWEILYRDPTEKGLLGRQYVLPNTSFLCNEEAFCEVYMGWNEQGLIVDAVFSRPFHHSHYPQLEEGDAIEIFVDTRDTKPGTNTRFCHHFFVLAKEVEGVRSGELTRFRTEDRHEHCDPQDIFVKVFSGNSIQIVLSNRCLNGYDPLEVPRIGVSYRVHRSDGPSQHYSATTREFPLDQLPSLWSSARLIR